MIIRGILLFLILLGASTLLMNVLDMPFGTVNYFEHHGFLFLIFLATFPRLTLLFSSVASGGLLWWVGWLFFPRILIAVLATFAYFHTNPILVVISWLIALSGETFEKTRIRTNRVYVQTFGSRQKHEEPQNKGDVIDVDFKRYD